VFGHELISETPSGALCGLAQGVSADRVDLLPLAPATADHLATYGVMDISLDPWPYAGTTTTCESLFMGEPNSAILRVRRNFSRSLGHKTDALVLQSVVALLHAELRGHRSRCCRQLHASPMATPACALSAHLADH